MRASGNGPSVRAARTSAAASVPVVVSVSWRTAALAWAVAALLGMATAGTAHAVNVWISPSDTTVSIGDPFLIRVEADAFTNLKGYDLIFQFDPAVLQLLGAFPGDVLTTPGNPFFGALVPESTAPQDSAWYDAAMLVGVTQTPGVLVYFQFKGIAVGESLLECRSADFRDPDNVQTLPGCTGGRVVVTSVVPASPATWGRIKSLYH
ncbi:MAG: cohesin domain-containing protein [Candidatus Eiseniibacteriota bacterium]